MSIFLVCRQNGSQTVKNFVKTKVTALVLISHFRGMFIIDFSIVLFNAGPRKQLRSKISSHGI